MSENFIDYPAALSRLLPSEAVAALNTALQGGLDPTADFPRQALEVSNGEFLLMPSTSPQAFGIKLISVSAPSHRTDLERIKGTYVLFDGDSLAPTAVIDGAAVTDIRTPAVSLSVVVTIVPQEDAHPLRTVIFGTGAQARAHAAAVRDCFPRREVDIIFISRTPPADADLAGAWLGAGTNDARRATQAAELVFLTTTATEPIVSRNDVRDDAVVIAVGSHSPHAREVAGDLMSIAQVVVEDLETTFREGGDVILAAEEGSIQREDVVSWSQLARGECSLHRTSPIVFKFTGMGWEDLIIAQAITAKEA